MDYGRFTSNEIRELYDHSRKAGFWSIGDVMQTIFDVSYSINLQCIQDINDIDRVFDGNSDQNTEVTHLLPARMHGRHIELHKL